VTHDDAVLIDELTRKLDEMTRAFMEWRKIAEERARQIVALSQSCPMYLSGTSGADGDAPIILHDATDPGPNLVAETRVAYHAIVDSFTTDVAFPARALRGGDGILR
jgi:hypothetical protein